MSDKRCFICDFHVGEKYFLLCTYSFQSTKKLLVEKLAAMLHNKMVLICRPSDVLCFSCVKTMETIERLDTCAIDAKLSILEFLDKKYACGGDLTALLKSQQTEPPNVVSGARIHKNADGEENIAVFNPESPSKKGLTFAELKRKSEERMAALQDEISKDIRSQVLLECNKCHYSTNYIQFEKRHLMRKNQIQKVSEMAEERLDTVNEEPRRPPPVNDAEVTAGMMADVKVETIDMDFDEDHESQGNEYQAEQIAGGNYQIIEVPNNMTYTLNDEGYDDVHVV